MPCALLQNLTTGNACGLESVLLLIPDCTLQLVEFDIGNTHSTFTDLRLPSPLSEPTCCGRPSLVALC